MVCMDTGKVDETIALYEDNLQKIKDGMKLSKSSDDAVGITMAYSPENIEYAKQEAETVTENKDSNENVFSEEQLLNMQSGNNLPERNRISDV